MSLHTSLALAGVLALTSCKTEPKASPQPSAEPAPSSPAAASPPSPAQPSPAQPSPAQPKLPTAAELSALIDQATRIEAKSGSRQKPTWSKDLTKEDIANLKAGIGEAKFSAGAPRCLPTVLVTLYQEKKELAELGAFCSSGTPDPLMRFEINKTMGSFAAQDPAKVKAALESPVDR